MESNAGGPLEGIRVVELGGIGPGPYAGMLLADMGADVIRLERPGARDAVDAAHRILLRGRRSVAIDLRAEGASRVVISLVESAHAVIEGFRPGVAERLGIGPQDCLAVNPRIVYGRATGWGQAGPRARDAGHDLTYLALTGALAEMGPQGGAPVPPLNLLGDFAAGGGLLVTGLLAALIRANVSGRGQVVDGAIVDGVASTTAMLWGMKHAGRWGEVRGTNRFDGSLPEYAVYECADGLFLAVGALEEQFYAAFVATLGLTDLPDRRDAAHHRTRREAISAVIRKRTRDEWAAEFAHVDACVAPVLTLTEAVKDDHLAARRTYVESDGVAQPGVAPRFSDSPGVVGRLPRERGADTRQVLLAAGLAPDDVDALCEAGVVSQPAPSPAVR